MSFASPELLLGLLIVPLALIGYLIVQRRRSRYAVRFTNVDLLANIAPRTPSWRRHLPPVLYLAAIAALAIGLARPSLVLAVPREEATIMLTMDVSRSMLATDVDPNRLVAAQQAATDFVDRLPEQFRVGLVAFSTDARLVVQPTTDRAEIHEALASLQADGGTAMGDAIALSLEASGIEQAQATASPDRRPPRTPRPPRMPPLPRTRRRRPTPTRPRSWRRSCCRTVPTRRAHWSRSRPPSAPPTSACRSTRSRSARRTAWCRCRTCSA